jgi:single-strand DNA-binding protein
MINNVVISGNLVRDPELKYLPTGSAICYLTVAVNRKYKSGETWKEEVSFFDVVVFGKSAEYCVENLHKGNGTVVSGRLKQETWETDGVKKSRVKIVADQVQFLKAKENKENAEEDAIPF